MILHPPAPEHELSDAELVARTTLLDPNSPDPQYTEAHDCDRHDYKPPKPRKMRNEKECAYLVISCQPRHDRPREWYADFLGRRFRSDEAECMLTYGTFLPGLILTTAPGQPCGLVIGEPGTPQRIIPLGQNARIA